MIQEVCLTLKLQTRVLETPGGRHETPPDEYIKAYIAYIVLKPGK